MDTEVARVATHIERAELLAAARATSQLTHVQRLLRQLLLDALARYRLEGRFPINRDFLDQTPYFVDASGTRCAMAHLLELGGESELVARIARERNNAWVRELADEPRLLAWLAAAGLTVEEAAAIQPAYCSQASTCVCGGDFSQIDYPVPARGVLEAVVGTNGMARVERTYGDTLGIATGMDIGLVQTYPAGTRVLAPIEARFTQYPSIAVGGDGMFHCRSQGVPNAPAIGPADFAAAVLSSDCTATLHAQDSAWRELPECGGNTFPDPDDDGGCSVSSESASVGILLAVVAALVRRR